MRPQPLPGGGAVYTERSGKQTITGAGNQVREVRTSTDRMRFSNGQPRFFQATRNGTTTSVTRGFGGQRTVETVRTDGTRVVSYGPHSGFVERPFANHPGFVTRSVLRGGVTRVSVYQVATFQSHPYYRFVPAVAYRPAYYGWIVSPWSAPVAYPWGNPLWGGFYGSYFTPYPSYSSASLWMTDYILRANLQQAYSEQQQAGYAGSAAGPDANYAGDGVGYPSQTGPAPVVRRTSADDQLSPVVKTALGQQTTAEIAEMQAASAAGSGDAPGQPALVPAVYTPTALKPNHTLFEISTDMQLEISADQSCALTPGDVLFRRRTSSADADGKVAVVVVGSTHGGCPLNTQGQISLQSLQEIENQYDEQLQAAMGVMAEKAGHGTIPPSPAAGATPLMAASAGPQPPEVDTMVQQSQTLGAKTENEVANSFQPAGSN